VVASLAKDPVNSVAIERRRNFIVDEELLEGWCLDKSINDEEIGIMSSRSVLRCVQGR
jgi:hypothetical protein